MNQTKMQRDDCLVNGTRTPHFSVTELSSSCVAAGSSCTVRGWTGTTAAPVDLRWFQRVGLWRTAWQADVSDAAFGVPSTPCWVLWLSWGDEGMGREWMGSRWGWGRSWVDGSEVGVSGSLWGGWRRIPQTGRRGASVWVTDCREEWRGRKETKIQIDKTGYFARWLTIPS